MTGFAAPRRKRGPPKKGRCIAVFGPPKGGTSTIIECLMDITEASTVCVFGLTGEALVEGVLEARRAADVVFIDNIEDPGDVQLLATNGLVDITNDGAIIQVHANPAMLDDERTAYNDKRAAVEQHVRTYSMPYFTIYNERDRLVMAVLDLARRSQLRK